MSDTSAQHIINETSFTQLFNTYWDKMLAVCYNTTNNLEASRGMVQDIFRSIWENRNSIQLQSPEHYLLRASKLKACEFIRNKVNREQHLQSATQYNPDITNSTEEAILHKELLHQLDSMVETMPGQRRKVYKLSQEAGLSNKEISSELQISEKTVSWHLIKAKETLQSNLSKLYEQ